MNYQSHILVSPCLPPSPAFLLTFILGGVFLLLLLFWCVCVRVLLLFGSSELALLASCCCVPSLTPGGAIGQKSEQPALCTVHIG